MAPPFIPFGKWQPDQPRTWGKPHLRDAKNVRPVTGGYGPAYRIAPLAEALASRPFGACAMRDTQGNVHVFAGDATDLYALENDATWDERTRVSGGDYATPTTGFWRFEQWEDYLFATNFIDDLQSLDVTTGGDFAAAAGTPPKCRFLKVFGDFLVAGCLSTNQMGIRWSAYRDPTGWTAGTNLSDQRSFPTDGFVMGLAATDMLYVFQQRAIRRGLYVGPPNIIQFERLETERGLLTPGSLCQIGRMIFFLADDGFYLMKDDALPVPIGDEHVDEWFRADVNIGALYRMTSAIDPDAKIVSWSYPSNASPLGVPDTVLNYHWTEGKWTYERKPALALFQALTLGYTLEGLDTIAPDIDAFEISLDDPILQGGDLRYAGFDESYRFGVFSGAQLEATLETGDFEVNPGRRAAVKRCLPRIGADDLTVALGSRESVADAIVYKTARAKQASGRVPVRGNGRYFNAKTVIADTATWRAEDPATGLSFETRDRGVK